MRYDASRGRYYYVDNVEMITTWNKPPCNASVPKGWRVVYDQRNNCFTYKNAPSIIETPKAQNLVATPTSHDSITLSWDPIPRSDATYKVKVKSTDKTENLTINCGSSTTCTAKDLRQNTKYHFWVLATSMGRPSGWSAGVAVKTQRCWDCIWKECPEHLNKERKYVVSTKNLRVITKTVDGWSTAVGNVPLPLDRVSMWDIKILKTKWDDGGNILVGVAPLGVDQDAEYNRNRCGWYIDCYEAKLCSGPPHGYSWKEYVQQKRRKRSGQYVRVDDVVGVIADMKRGEISFALNDANLGVAYEGIPVDKPIVPCVIFYWSGDSVEIDF